MKILNTFILLLIATAAFSSPKNGGNILITTTAEANNMVFELKLTQENVINIFLDGVDDKYGTLSIINSKGESEFFQFITETQSNYFFDLNELKKGTYYVKLNASNEIRMKTIVVD